jgi:tetratricopeptide (TPR) repeat protein
MMRPILLSALLTLCAATSAQPDTKRIDAIWSAANERIGRQTDAWFKAGDFPRTIQLLRFHYNMHPKDYEIATNLGFMLENIEQDDKALAVYIQLRNVNAEDPDSAWPEANFYFKKKAYAKVPPILEPTIKDHDPHANNYRTLAHSYERMNMLADSKRVWELYISKHPDDLTAKANLNRVLKKLKDGSPKKGQRSPSPFGWSPNP